MSSREKKRQKPRRTVNGQKLGTASKKISGRLVQRDARVESIVSFTTNWKYRGSSRSSGRPGTLERVSAQRRRGAARYKVTRNYICILFQFCRLFNCSNAPDTRVELEAKFS